MRTTITILFTVLLCILKVFGQAYDKFEPYHHSDYPNNKYQITVDTITFSGLKIEIRRIKPFDHITLSPDDFYCRAWMTISKAGKTIKQIYLKDIDPVGSCNGLFIPNVQPRKDYFLISKFGDYDGLILIIDKKGNLTQKLGGKFYISNDKRYLFSAYDSDLSGLTVYDFNSKRTIFSDTIQPYLDDWYFQDNKYFAIVYEGALANDLIKIATFDFIKKKIIISTVSKNYPKDVNKLLKFNDIYETEACNCGR